MHPVITSQPHSKLNMYKKAEDEKSDLILSALSWVDHLKPKYCLFENVQGFLDYRLNAQQDGRYTTQGGVERGGIKFLVRTLTALGYVGLSVLRNGDLYFSRTVIKSDSHFWRRDTTAHLRVVFDFSCGRHNRDIPSRNFRVPHTIFLAEPQCQSSFPSEQLSLR